MLGQLKVMVRICIKDDIRIAVNVLGRVTLDVNSTQNANNRP